MPGKIRQPALNGGPFLLENKSTEEVIPTDTAIMYPRQCRKNIRRIMDEVGAGPETAYAMMLMTAMMMDLRPEDDEVLEIILEDCGVEVGA